MYKLLQELKEPSVIYEEDPEDPNNPEVLIKGIGRMKLKQLERNVRRKLQDLAKTEHWDQVQWKLTNDALGVMVDTLKRAHEELAQKRD